MLLIAINGVILRDVVQADSFGRLIRSFFAIPKPEENLLRIIINRRSNLHLSGRNLILMQRMTGLKRSRKQTLHQMFFLLVAIPPCLQKVILLSMRDLAKE